MDWLAVFVILAVVGQLCLPLVGAYRQRRAHGVAKRRADLLEAAADRQNQALFPQSAKLDTQQKGVGSDE